MINLIPPGAQNQVKREYWLRVFTVWIILIASACMMIATLYMPVYVLVRSQLDAFLQAYTQASIESDSFKDSELAIEKANEIAKLLSEADKAISFSTVIFELEEVSQAHGVTITEFVLLREKGELQPIVLRGIALSRLDLTSFRDAIEAHELFKSAELPLSNLAKDKDITFGITIKPEEK
jgi:hypothetical protein